MTWKIKISLDSITYGSKDPDDVEALMTAHDLMKQGYRKTSNAYCRVSRIDREDWLDVLAKQRRCSRADFYNVDGSGIGDQHRNHYIRVFSNDTHVVHPKVLKLVKSY